MEIPSTQTKMSRWKLMKSFLFWQLNRQSQLMQETTHAQPKMHSVPLPSPHNSSSQVSGHLDFKWICQTLESNKLILPNVTGPPTWIQKPVDTKTVLGSSLDIICSASGQPNPVITWKKHRGIFRSILQQINFNSFNSGHLESFLPFNGPRMRIESVKSADAGSYTCQASNGVGQDLFANFILSVKGTRNAFHWIFVTCFARHWFLSVPFTRNEALLGGWTVAASLCNHEFHFGHANFKLGGVFADFSAGFHHKLWVGLFLLEFFLIETSAELKVAKFEFPGNAKLNGRISVTCSAASGTPPFQFEWLRNGVPIDKNERVNLVTTEDFSTLTFRQVKIEDAANYTCIAKNREGMDAFTARLKMNCKWVMDHL